MTRRPSNANAKRHRRAVFGRASLHGSRDLTVLRLVCACDGSIRVWLVAYALGD